MEDFAVTCRLVPDVPHLGSGSCSSPRAFGLGFLQTPPRDDALALLLAFGSAFTWREDLHPARSVPCLAHTACSGASNGRDRAAIACRLRQLVRHSHYYSPSEMVGNGLPSDNRFPEDHACASFSISMKKRFDFFCLRSCSIYPRKDSCVRSTIIFIYSYRMFSST